MQVRLPDISYPWQPDRICPCVPDLVNKTRYLWIWGVSTIAAGKDSRNAYEHVGCGEIAGIAVKYLKLESAMGGNEMASLRW